MSSATLMCNDWQRSCVWREMLEIPCSDAAVTQALRLENRADSFWNKCAITARERGSDIGKRMSRIPPSGAVTQGAKSLGHVAVIGDSEKRE